MAVRGHQRPPAVGAAATGPIRRRDDPVRTLTLTKPSTTITTPITLGQPPPTTASSSTVSILTLDAMAPYTTPVAPANVVRSADLTQDQIGAVIGAVVGFVLLCLVVWYFLSQTRMRRTHRRYSHRRSSRSYSTTSSEGSSSSDSSDDRRRRRRSRRPRGGGDPSRAPTRGQPMRGQPMPRRPPVAYAGRPAFNLTRPPTTFPPPVREGYSQTWNPQIRGVKRYP